MREAAVFDHRGDDVAIGGHRAQRRITRREALGHRDDVGTEPPVFAGEETAGAAGAGHDLVGDQQDAVLAADRLDLVIPAVRTHQRPRRGAADRFHDEGQHRVGALAFDLGTQPRRIAQAAFLEGEGVAVQVAGRRRDLRHHPDHVPERFDELMHARDRDGAERGAVIGRE